MFWTIKPQSSLDFSNDKSRFISSDLFFLPSRNTEDSVIWQICSDSFQISMQFPLIEALK